MCALISTESCDQGHIHSTQYRINSLAVESVALDAAALAPRILRLLICSGMCADMALGEEIGRGLCSNGVVSVDALWKMLQC
jgi:hypothetical protein